MQMPFFLRSATSRISASTSWRVSEAVGSSMITSLASAAIARQIATSWRLAIERSSTLRVRIERDVDARHRRLARSHGSAFHLTRCGRAEMAPDGDVLGDGEVREQRKVLIDHLDAAAGRLDGIEMRRIRAPR